MDNDNHKVNTNAGKKSFVFIDFDGASDLQYQEHYQSESNAVLDELLGLVCVSEMPIETRLHLINGIDHIRWRNMIQTQLLTSDISGRKC